MTKPPKSTPHSDLDGVRQDERPKTARDAGQDGADLERVHRESAGRPPHSDSEEGKAGGR